MSVIQSPRAKAYALLLVNTILWGFSSPIIKSSLNYIPYNQFLLWRYLIATLIFLPIYVIFIKPKIHIKHKIPKLELIGLALIGTPLTLIPLYYGLNQTSSIEASILSATSPIFTIVAGWLFLKEKITPKEKFGILVAIAGTTLIILEPILQSSNSNHFSGSPIGNLLIIVSNLIWTTYLVLAKKLSTESNQITLASFLVSIPVFLLLSICELPGNTLPTFIFSLPPTAYLGIIYMAIFGSIIAFWAYTEGQKKIEASEAAVFTYLQPVFALPLATLWLKESLSQTLVLASLILVLGVYLSEKR